jgi:hypothetical protein
MKKSKYLVLGLLLILVITGCSTGRINSLERKSNECIVIAKVYIKNYGEDFTYGSRFFFDGRTRSVVPVYPDDFYYIYFKLTLGNHFLGRIENDDRSINLYDDYLRFETPESKIYYLGDISTELSLDMNYGSFLYVFGAIGGIVGNRIYENRSVKQPKMVIENRIGEAITYFNSIFENKEEIIQCKIYNDSTNIFTDTLKPEGTNKKELRRQHK